MKKLINIALITLIMITKVTGQEGKSGGIIKGRVYDKVNNEPLSYANVVIQGTQKGTTTDETGKFLIEGLEPGFYNIQVKYLGYQPKVISEIQVSKAKPVTLRIGLEQTSVESKEVEITASPFDKEPESPLSKKDIGVAEIERNPGSNRDISAVVQNYPGVSTTSSFRNDLLIRGGAPNENTFYIDGIEVPNINHFATQGATGGPIGMINVDFIRGVDLYTGAFPVNRSNALSGILDFKFKDAMNEDPSLRGTIGASEVALSGKTGIGENTGILFSLRRSYLQFLFELLGQPFLPTYNDANFKLRHRFDKDNEITLLGIGAIDNFSLNEDDNNSATNRYIINNLPINEQWNYTTGAKFTHYEDNGYFNLVFSRYHLNNRAFKYEDNIEQPENLLLDYESDEIENQFRFEHIYRTNGYKFTYGANYALTTFKNSTFNRFATPNGIDTSSFDSRLNLQRYGLFGQVSKSFLADRLSLSMGVRGYANNYSTEMQNPLNQISPRFSASYEFAPKWSVNFNTGIYHQKPPYTVMGYKKDGDFVNRDRLKYIRSKHLVAGIQYLTEVNTKISVESYFKDYDRYPFLLDDGISLANRGGDFGVVGNAPADASSKGQTYGVELMVQQKLYKGFYGVLAYTLGWSEFTDGEGNYVPSAWDNRHVISVTGGKKFGKNWELGVKWRFQSGAPYTPYDREYSSRKAVWRVSNQGIPDYERLNSRRLSPTHALDVRLDKKFYWDNFNLDVYLDVQNAYNYQADGQPYLTVERDEEGNPITDPNDPSRYKTKLLDNELGTFIPSIGVVFEL